MNVIVTLPGEKKLRHGGDICKEDNQPIAGIGGLAYFLDKLLYWNMQRWEGACGQYADGSWIRTQSGIIEIEIVTELDQLAEFIEIRMAERNEMRDRAKKAL